MLVVLRVKKNSSISMEEFFFEDAGSLAWQMVNDLIIYHPGFVRRFECLPWF